MKHLLLTTIAAVLIVGCGNSQADFALSQAVFKRDIAAAKQAIDDGADVDGKDRNRSTHLLLAASKGDKETADLLIANGADVNAKDGGLVPPLHFESTPLHSAVGGNHKEVAELLIAKGADVNAKGVLDGNTPLHWAAWNGHTEVAEFLIEKGAHVNAKNGLDQTPLNLAEAVLPPAAAHARKETADLLRKHGGKTGEELKAEGK